MSARASADGSDLGFGWPINEAVALSVLDGTLIETWKRLECVELRLFGELTAATVTSLAPELLAPDPCGNVLLDLSGVADLETEALEELEVLQRRSPERHLLVRISTDQAACLAR